MVQDGLADVLEILPVGKEIPPEMPFEKSVEAKEDAIDHKNPGKEEMPTPSHGQPLLAGQCGPTWKAPCPLPGKAKHSSGVKGMPRHHGDSFALAAVASDRCHCQDGTIPIGAVAPIQGGMRIENLEPAHNQNREAEEIDPVTEADG